MFEECGGPEKRKTERETRKRRYLIPSTVAQCKHSYFKRQEDRDRKELYKSKITAQWGRY